MHPLENPTHDGVSEEGPCLETLNVHVRPIPINKSEILLPINSVIVEVDRCMGLYVQCSIAIYWEQFICTSESMVCELH
jgi:hypothetical protein